MVKESLNKQIIENLVCVSSKEMLIFLPVSIFFNDSLYLYSQIIGLPKNLPKILDRTYDSLSLGIMMRKPPKLTLLVISHQEGH